MSNIVAHERGFVFRDGEMIPLPGLAGYPLAVPSAINNHDQIVGSCVALDGAEIGFLHLDGVTCDVKAFFSPHPDWKIVSLNDINDEGWMVGAIQRDEVYRAVLLKPIGRWRKHLLPPPSPAAAGLDR